MKKGLRLGVAMILNSGKRMVSDRSPDEEGVETLRRSVGIPSSLPFQTAPLMKKGLRLVFPILREYVENTFQTAPLMKKGLRQR